MSKVLYLWTHIAPVCTSHVLPLHLSHRAKHSILEIFFYRKSFNFSNHLDEKVFHLLH